MNCIIFVMNVAGICAGNAVKRCLEAVFDYEEIGRKWKQKPEPLLFSAVNPEFYPPLPVGNTPFFKVRIPV
jgi:hypothetical protein